MISWVGLRGAAPIVLATFPLLAGIENAELLFNIVFFVVLISVLIQGTSIPLVSKLLKVNAPLEKRGRVPIEIEHREGLDAELIEFIVPYEGNIVGKAIWELGLPSESLAVLVCRDDKFIIAKGTTVLDSGDVVLVLVKKDDLQAVKKIFCELKEKSGNS
jgi:cell volume regulation protein A